MEVAKKLIITMTDLDHILDIDLLENKNVPPSQFFLEGLKKELELNGIDDVIESIEIRLNKG